MLILLPLSMINGAVRVLIRSEALHFVFNPVTFIAFWCEVGRSGNGNFSVTMLHLFAFEKLPVSFILNSIEVLEPRKSWNFMGKRFRFRFFGRFFDRLGVFFWWHWYIISCIWISSHKYWEIKISSFGVILFWKLSSFSQLSSSVKYWSVCIKLGYQVFFCFFILAQQEVETSTTVLESDAIVKWKFLSKLDKSAKLAFEIFDIKFAFF